MEILEQISQSLQEGNDELIAELVKAAFAKGLCPKEILQKGLIAGMENVGRKFKEHEIFLPDVLMAAKAMNVGMTELKPFLAGEELPRTGKIVLGTVQGDLHDIGKNLVGIILRGAGFDVIDLGNDVPPEKFLETAEKEKADFVGMSALLTTTMPMMKKVIRLIKEKLPSGRIKTIVGGAPVTQEYAMEIGADAYAPDAHESVSRLKNLIER